MAKNNKIPKCPPLRFPQFNDKWEQTTLGEIAEIKKGFGLSKDDLSKEGSPVILYGELYTTYKSEVITQIKSRTKANDARLIKSSGGEVIIPCSGETAIDIATARCVMTSGVILGGDLNIMDLKEHNGVFLAYLLNGINKHLIARIAQGSSVVHLYSKELEKLSLSLPSLAEQKKIASFLSLIDERIESCSEIIKEIKTLKAGLLSLRVYQADKQYVPLSYFGEMKHGYPFKSTSYDEDGTHRIVTISNVSGARYADMSKCNYLAELPHDIQQHQILSRNDILISLTGNVGRVSFCLADGDLLNQRVGVLSLCDEAYKEYIYQVLSDWRFEMSMVACGQGAAQLNISKSNVEGYLVPYEQSEYQEIGNFFSLLDDRIEIEEELLKQYEMQKKYLLRQMFI